MKNYEEPLLFTCPIAFPQATEINCEIFETQRRIETASNGFYCNS